MSDMYLFSSAPRAVPSTIVSSKQAKYRDVPVNIMFDKRVVRGPTVQAKPTVIALQPQSSSATLHSKQQNKQTRATASDNNLLSTIPNASTLQFAYNTSTSVQTDDYLEDLINDVDECDSFAQTDDSHTDHDVDRVLALFAPAVRGIDASTCIEGQELFDFDIEVESILAVLVGKSLDQAEIEVNEEEELAALTKQRAAFTAERARVIAETMRLEAENSRRMAEKQRRYEQERERVTEQQRIALQRDAARAAQQAMLELERQTQAAIKAQWKDPVRQEVESSFMPWLSQSVEIQLAARRQYIERVDALISESIQAIDFRVAECLRIKQERKEYEAQQAAALLAQQAAEQAEQELRRLEAVKRQAEAEAEAEALQKQSEDSEPADEEDEED